MSIWPFSELIKVLGTEKRANSYTPLPFPLPFEAIFDRR